MDVVVVVLGMVEEAKTMVERMHRVAGVADGGVGEGG